jgi:hypothetical protein
VQQPTHFESKKLTPEDEKAKISLQLENQIVKFIKSKEIEFNFPPSLGGDLLDFLQFVSFQDLREC